MSFIDDKYNKRTLYDIGQLDSLENAARNIRDSIYAIKANCTCRDYILEHVETFKFIYAPKRICVVCKKVLVEEPTREEKITLLKEYCEFYEIDMTPDLVEERIDGFNSPIS